MYQTIIVSPTALYFLEQGFTPNALEFLRRLQTETLAIDSRNVLGSEYQMTIENSSRSDLLKFIWGDLVPRLRFQKYEVNVRIRKLDELSELVNEIQIAHKTDWKIIIAEVPPDIIRDFTLRENHIEACCVQSYLFPTYTSLIRAEEHFELKLGEEFNFRQWLKKYLIDVRYLEIADGYLVRERAFLELKYILSLVSSEIPINILTLSDNARNRSSKYPDKDKVMEKLYELQGSYPKLELKIFEDKKELETRWIKTDRFKIIPEKGLGFVNEQNKVIKQTAITVLQS